MRKRVNKKAETANQRDMTTRKHPEATSAADDDASVTERMRMHAARLDDCSCPRCAAGVFVSSPQITTPPAGSRPVAVASPAVQHAEPAQLSFDPPASFTQNEDVPSGRGSGGGGGGSGGRNRGSHEVLIHDEAGSLIAQTGPGTGTPGTGTRLVSPTALRLRLPQPRLGVQHKRVFSEPEEEPISSKNYGGIDQHVFQAQLRMVRTKHATGNESHATLR